MSLLGVLVYEPPQTVRRNKVNIPVKPLPTEVVCDLEKPFVMELSCVPLVGEKLEINVSIKLSENTFIYRVIIYIYTSGIPFFFIVVGIDCGEYLSPN